MKKLQFCLVAASVLVLALSAFAQIQNGQFTGTITDPSGAAGPNGVIQVVNVRLAYWDKEGRAIWGPTSLNGFFGSVGN